ncbi:MAG: Dabb family protein [Alphaproteobacteria bacterium]|nr:Dabb family protein [Alphaproteobacteria bacterium]MBU1548626.1 Dabb family protein [Alphaproteobacteria bacterium]MBU2334380.1 Dabb family protein [Alphaproteobacteria bacterium]MBU2389921.1 Dabb family protein [Alphaproteobacteria bacterium]|tara:strand:- start:733 stop:1080 length:348 start_codon:yes stop_codon:yes gene_type:complete
MIRHIVFFTAPPEKVEQVRKGLSLLTEIPHARRLEIGTSIKRDPFGNEVDVVVYGEFEDVAALDAFQAHPLYQVSIDAVRPIRDMRIAADYQTTDAVTRASGIVSAYGQSSPPPP